MGFEETRNKKLAYEEALKYAGEMISIGESRKALEKICEVLGVATDYFDDEDEENNQSEDVYKEETYDYYDIESSPDGKFYLMNKVDNYYCYDKNELTKGVFEDREFAELVADLLNKDHGEGYEGRR